MILDDLKYIHTKDASDAFGAVAKQPAQLNLHLKVQGEAASQSINSIVFAAMGGSAVAAMIAQSWIPFSIPLEMWRRYSGPEYLSERSLCIISSYSGNTEESLSAFDAALSKKAPIAVITGGGKLAEKAQKHGCLLVLLPDIPHPRYGVFANLVALLNILQVIGLCSDLKTAKNRLSDASELLETECKNWLPEIPAKNNPAKQLALELAGTTPIIYAGEKMFPAAYKWKLAFNENAKNLAWCNEIPEFCHNEFSGWTSHPVEKAFSVVDLYSAFEHPQILKRFELSAQLLSGKRPHPFRVSGKGKNVLEHVLYLSLLGDFVSLYVAILNGIDPMPLPYVDKLKSALA